MYLSLLTTRLFCKSQMQLLMHHCHSQSAQSLVSEPNLTLCHTAEIAGSRLVAWQVFCYCDLRVTYHGNFSTKQRHDRTVLGVHDRQSTADYALPVSNDYPRFLPSDLLNAQKELSARLKLNLILSSKSVQDKPIHVVDVVQIFTRLSNQKRGTWSEPRTVIEYDPNSQTVTVAGTHGRKRKAAVKDIRFAVSCNELIKELQSAIDELGTDLGDAVSDLFDEEHSITDPRYDVQPLDDDSVSDSEPFVYTEHENVAEGSDSNGTDPMEAVTYIPAVPSTFDPDVPTSDDSVSQQPESSPPSASGVAPRWKQLAPPSTHQMQTRSGAKRNSTDDAVEGNEIELLPGTELSSTEQAVLNKYYEKFKSKEFLLHHAAGLPSFVLENAYKAEEENFVKQCIPSHFSKVPTTANVIRSHVLYKIKRRDDGTLTCKARIAPHGNEDMEKDNLKTDSASCPPLGIRILFSLCVVFQWYLTKIDIKGAFLQSGNAARDVYVVLPRECSNRHFIWLLLVATYGLVNANAKWQLHSDQTLYDLGLHTLVFVPQFFFLIRNGSIVLSLVKVTDDLFIAGPERLKRNFIKKLADVYTIGTINHLPGSCWFFGMEVTQDRDFSVQVHADQKLQNLNPHQLSRTRRKCSTDSLNSMKLTRFNSINGSIGFIGVYACPLASFVSSYLQQQRNSATIKDLTVQASLLKKLVSFGSVSTYCRPESGRYRFSLIAFADAARPSEYGQLGIICGLLFGDFIKGSIFHVLSWSSNLSKRAVKSIGAAETLATGFTIDECILISNAISNFVLSTVPVTIIVDSKDLYESLTSCHVPEDKSIRADVQLIRYFFETRQIDKVVWIPGSQNLADPLTKKDSPLQEALQLLVYEEKLPFAFENALLKTSTPNLG